MIRRKKRDDFYNSEAWFRIRYIVLRRDKGKCQLCGRSRKHGIQLQVDHIYPRSLYPHLELELENLQTLCRPCNLGKSNLFADDWR
ncbi:HNH endonuclease [Rufibacter sediminis]|uniref:HNH endonuclease n=1 Tax=Rufibacter sediminis TaxID=2762756 RepID=A0ABR6VTW3_9BACT|nr:HNH endonuclease [Rufibacter sediminis]MBC3540635.1 HNH endonuclease [Rufibacter sediminis]